MDSQVPYYCEISATALPPEKLESLVFINIHHVTKEFIEDPSGVRTFIGPHLDPSPSPIILYLQSSHPRYINQLLLEKFLDPALCEKLASEIAPQASRMGLGHQGFYMFVDMTLFKERVFLVSGSSPPPRGASEALLQRLVEEQSLDSAERPEGSNLETETCTICLEKLLGSDTALVKMPCCRHVFHQECLVEWLRRTNSCPLCRSVTYEDDETE